MPVIDKNMYDTLKSWFDCDDKSQYDQSILYVNSSDRSLTDATIRKLMFELTEEDKDGELYLSLYSAENYLRNMEKYYLDIAESYFCEPKPKAKLTTIIKNIPPTCGWILLIVKDIEVLSGHIKELHDLIESLHAFGTKCASIILVGSGEYKDVFSGCEYALQVINEKDNKSQSAIGFYDQAAEPNQEIVIYENTDKQLDELNYFWITLRRQLQKEYFDYEAFKHLYRDTLGYLIQRVSLEYVYRKDVSLIESMVDLNLAAYQEVDGCKTWEKDAALQFISGLNKAVINRFDRSDVFYDGKVKINVIIEDRVIDKGSVHISGWSSEYRKISVDNICEEIDKLSGEIFKRRYKN